MKLTTELKKIKSTASCQSGSLDGFEQSIEDFNSMVESGVASRRGYNLQTIDSCTRYSVMRF